MKNSSLPGLVPVVVLVLAAELFVPGEMLEYRRSLLGSEPWRLLTGHFVHLSVLHALLNCVALLLIGQLFAGRLQPRELYALLGAAPILISLVLWAGMPQLAWYRGLSGTLHALYFAGSIAWLAASRGHARWLPGAALVAGTAKVLLEQPWDGSFPMREWLGAAVVPQAHLAGALVGIAAGIWIAKRRRLARPFDQDQAAP